MKKLTKKEMEAIKEEERRLRSKRLNMMSQLESYWKDVEATIRVARLNNDEETFIFHLDSHVPAGGGDRLH